MIKRLLENPGKTFLLLGPRGTGKSTWLKQAVNPSLSIDLLSARHYLKLTDDPTHLRQLTAQLKKGDWVIIDEIQRVPSLLSEVHSLYEDKRLQFALTGSSARKLKRGAADLLAGRALQTFMFPLVFSEYKDQCSCLEAIRWGTLPSVVTEKKFRVQTLASYVETYLKEELVAEAIIRKLDPFVRFLQVAGLYSGQVLNIENIAREASIKRPTVDHYFQILEDTLIATRVPAYQPRLKTREVAHPKFYFFDCGVARAAAGLLDDELDEITRGSALETLVLNELRAYNHYYRRNRPLFHYSISGSYDIDFVVETKKKTLTSPGAVVLIEVKSSKKWNPKWCKSLVDFQNQSKAKVERKIGVYLGEDRLTIQGVDILPLERFLELLFNGEWF